MIVERSKIANEVIIFILSHPSYIHEAERSMYLRCQKRKLNVSHSVHQFSEDSRLLTLAEFLIEVRVKAHLMSRDKGIIGAPP